MSKWKQNFTKPWKEQKANKDHRCTWCGKDICKGEVYANWTSPRAGDGSFGGWSKVHCACMPALMLGEYEYTPFRNARNPQGRDRNV